MCIRNAYVSIAVNVPAVTSRYHGTLDLTWYARFITIREISKVTRNTRRLRHIHVNITVSVNTNSRNSKSSCKTDKRISGSVSSRWFLTAKVKPAKPNEAYVSHIFFIKTEVSWQLLPPILRICNYENNGTDGALHLARSDMILKYSKLHKIMPVYKILFWLTTQNLI
jgi:hypothetical protein